MTLWVIGFLVVLFLYIFWGLNAIVGAIDDDPLNPTMSAFATDSAKEDPS